MIGVAAPAEQHHVVHEFFELFKTPWEFCRSGVKYDVLLHAGGPLPPCAAKLVITYDGAAGGSDRDRSWAAGSQRQGAMLSWDGERIPVYGRAVTVASTSAATLVVEDTREPVVAQWRKDGVTFVGVGFDLFEEVRRLLTSGQPAANAAIPTLERHLAFLRSAILAAGIPLVEIPPLPNGSPFIVCLTHDIDHPAIRLHKCDRTMWGFFYRAVIGSAIDACRGRRSLAALCRNWAAALRLPFVHMGLARDFWSDFGRYLAIEEGLGSTFFVIPVKNYPGRTLDGPAPRLRASAYAAPEIADRVKTLCAARCEVGLHGLDAWLDSGRGAEERQLVSSAAGAPPVGVRMHWLFFDDRAPRRLEEAGFTYDSTFGYNDTIGFRAGTLQVFKPLSAGRLLELPLSVMDTALFYPAYLNLTPRSTGPIVQHVIDAAERHGGALTINWHDRSLAPERQWGKVYVQLIDDLKRRGAWFPTAAQAVSWFARRRAATFEAARCEGHSVRIRASAPQRAGLPGLRIRVHTPRPTDAGPLRSTSTFTDVPLEDELDARVALSAA